LIEWTGLTQNVRQPTRGSNILDRVFVSNPHLYGIVRVVKSIVRSDHKAVVAFSDNINSAQPKSMYQRTFQRKSPAQHAMFLKYASTMPLNNLQSAANLDQAINTRSEFAVSTLQPLVS
jgi:hypothetical protein